MAFYNFWFSISQFLKSSLENSESDRTSKVSMSLQNTKNKTIHIEQTFRLIEKGRAYVNPNPNWSQNQIGTYLNPNQVQKLSKTKYSSLRRNTECPNSVFRMSDEFLVFGELLDLFWSQIWFWLQFGFGLAKARPFSIEVKIYSYM